jgi:RNA polymerase sigma factor (sigma-70 family)
MENTTLIKAELFELDDFLRKLAWKYAKNYQDANDLLQETKCKALEKISYFRTGTNFKAWISIVMRNIFINEYRKKKKQVLVPIEDTYTLLEVQESNVEFSLLRDEFNKIIDNMDDKYQDVIHLCMKGYNYADIASHLDLPLGTVKSRIHQARKKLKSSYQRQNFISSE